ncbi:MAG TPA: pyruvoyl-dependent arginine decarboxylase [Malonomonas sp.]
MNKATRFFLSCATSEGATSADALDSARIEAGIGQLNLIDGCSLLPPGAALTDPQALNEALLVPALTAQISSEIPGEIISAAVAVAWPTDSAAAGVARAYAACGHKEDIEGIARRMAEAALLRRGQSVSSIQSTAAQHRVKQLGSALAAVITIA